MLYKRYHNEIVGLLKITKEAYYKKYFQENKKTVKPYGVVSMKSSKTIPLSQWLK